MSNTTAELMNRGMSCLLDTLGSVDAERFISILLREQFDYTKWQREYFDKMSAEEIYVASHRYAAAHPHKGRAETVL